MYVAPLKWERRAPYMDGRGVLLYRLEREQCFVIPIGERAVFCYTDWKESSVLLQSYEETGLLLHS